MIDSIEHLSLDGGPRSLGLVAGTKRVDPDDWFFRAHFYQDPVCPGSLGVESFLQLLKVLAVERWGPGTFAELLTGKAHRWLYRGQIVPTNREVSVQAIITEIDDARRWLVADGWLSVDERVIYQMNDFSLGMAME
jgi:3-hydroxymyristoyl/3-hydroxydecanoyl-(acyl carrier protein) dehydratase